MAILSIDPVSVSSQLTAERHRNYTAVYRVQSDDPMAAPQDILTAPQLPQYGYFFRWPHWETTPTANQWDAWSFCQTLGCTHTDLTHKRGWFTCTYTYTSRPFPRQEISFGSPLNEPEVLSGSVFQRDKHVSKDVDDKPIVTAAEEPMGIARIDDAGETLVVTRNTANINLTTRNQMMNSRNNAVFYGFPIGRVRLVAWDFSTEYFFGSEVAQIGVPVPFIAHRLEFRVDTSGLDHKQEFLHEGLMAYTDLADPYPVIMTDNDGNDVKSPQMLDDDGLRLAKGDPPTYRTFQFYPEADFSQLPVTGNLPSHISA